MKVGYARVSIHSQKDISQLDDLIGYGIDREHLFVDHGVRGKYASRPQLDAALAYMREGDVFVITRMCRAMRSLHDLLDIVNGTRAGRGAERTGGLKSRGIGLVVIKQGIDTTTPQGRLIFHFVAAIDEFQRELIVEGTNEGLASARARGRVGGRRPKLNEKQRATVFLMYAAKGTDGRRLHTVQDIADAVGVHRATVYDYLRAAS